MASSKTITLISSDGETFDLDVVAAMESQLIKGMIEDGCADNAILVPNVTSRVLAKVIEYCKKHVETPEADEHAVNDELKAWDADFVKVDRDTLFDLINAANYLDIKSLLDFTCQTVADMIKGKTLAEIDEIFNREHAFTPEEEEEEEEIRSEYPRLFNRNGEWVFE